MTLLGSRKLSVGFLVAVGVLAFVSPIVVFLLKPSPGMVAAVSMSHWEFTQTGIVRGWAKEHEQRLGRALVAPLESYAMSKDELTANLAIRMLVTDAFSEGPPGPDICDAFIRLAQQAPIENVRAEAILAFIKGCGDDPKIQERVLGPMLEDPSRTVRWYATSRFVELGKSPELLTSQSPTTRRLAAESILLYRKFPIEERKVFALLDDSGTLGSATVGDGIAWTLLRICQDPEGLKPSLGLPRYPQVSTQIEEQRRWGSIVTYIYGQSDTNPQPAPRLRNLLKDWYSKFGSLPFEKRPLPEKLLETAEADLTTVSTSVGTKP